MQDGHLLFSNIEAGRHKPHVTLAEKIATALGVSVGEIGWPSSEELATKRPKERPKPRE